MNYYNKTVHEGTVEAMGDEGDLIVTSPGFERKIVLNEYEVEKPEVGADFKFVETGENPKETVVFGTLTEVKAVDEAGTNGLPDNSIGNQADFKVKESDEDEEEDDEDDSIKETEDSDEEVEEVDEEVDTSDKTYECDVCGKEFDTHQALGGHTPCPEAEDEEESNPGVEQDHDGDRIEDVEVETPEEAQEAAEQVLSSGDGPDFRKEAIYALLEDKSLDDLSGMKKFELLELLVMTSDVLDKDDLNVNAEGQASSISQEGIAKLLDEGGIR